LPLPPHHIKSGRRFEPGRRTAVVVGQRSSSDFCAETDWSPQTHGLETAAITYREEGVAIFNREITRDCDGHRRWESRRHKLGRCNYVAGGKLQKWKSINVRQECRDAAQTPDQKWRELV